MHATLVTIVGLMTLLLCPPAAWAELFDEHSILEVTLSGPLTTVIRSRHGSDEHPFQLSVGDTTRNVAVRARGTSRLELCRFPPLRLNFRTSEVADTVFHGQDKLKLVSHCRSGDKQAQDAMLNEYAAYRVFKQITDKSYRVRLLRIRYVDSDSKQKGLDEAHYGFLIESTDALAQRLGGAALELPGVQFSELDFAHTGRLNVFQYLLGNSDWSFVRSDYKDSCCHNIDLLRVDEMLVPVPFDFDLAAMTRAKYRSGGKLQQSKLRKYTAYCRTPDEHVAAALDHVAGLQERIMETLEAAPAVEERSRKRRLDFAARFFKEAADRERLLKRFALQCT